MSPLTEGICLGSARAHLQAMYISATASMEQQGAVVFLKPSLENLLPQGVELTGATKAVQPLCCMPVRLFSIRSVHFL
jgi:hypothetical protein